MHPDRAFLKVVQTIQKQIEYVEGPENVDWSQLNATNDPLTKLRSVIGRAENGAVGWQSSSEGCGSRRRTLLEQLSPKRQRDLYDAILESLVQLSS